MSEIDYTYNVVYGEWRFMIDRKAEIVIEEDEVIEFKQEHNFDTEREAFICMCGQYIMQFCHENPCFATKSMLRYILSSRFICES